jgi:hypothetical protein
VRQSARGGWSRFSITGSLFQKVAAVKHRAGAGTRDANKGSRIEGASVEVLPSEAHILCPSDAAGRGEVAERVYDCVSSDATKIMSSVDPAWRV